MEELSPRVCDIGSGLASPNSLGQIVPQMSFSPQAANFSYSETQG